VKRVTTAVTVLVTALAVAAALAFVAFRGTSLPGFCREALTKAVREAVDRRIGWTSDHFTLLPRPALTLRGVTVRERDGEKVFAAAQAVVVKAALLPLLRGEVSVSEVAIAKPQVTLRRDGRGGWNAADLLGGERLRSFHIHRLSLADGTLVYEDPRLEKSGVLTFPQVALEASDLGPGRETNLRLRALVRTEGAPVGLLEAEGGFRLPAGGKSAAPEAADIRLGLDNIDLGVLAYFRPPPSGPWEVQGTLGAAVTLKMTKGRLDGTCRFTARRVRLLEPRLFDGPLRPERVNLEMVVKREGPDLRLSDVRLAVDDLEATGNISLARLEGPDPFIEAAFRIGPFDYGPWAPYVPHRILPAKVSAYIKDHLRGGTFRVDGAVLRGRWGRVGASAPGGLDFNVRARVEGGELDYGPRVPRLTAIGGELVLDPRDFRLVNMKGLFGDAVVALDGAIKDYGGEGPARYPFKAEIRPGREAVAWLVGKGAESLTYGGESVLAIEGDGPAADYGLHGEWDLGSASLKAGGFVKKAGVPARLAFRARVGERGIFGDDLSLRLGSLVLSGQARYLFGEDGGLSFSLSSNLWQVGEAQRFWPAAAAFRPRGEARFSLKGEWSRAGLPRRPLTIEASLAGVSLSGLPGGLSVGEARGPLRVVGERVETAGLSLALGNSRLNVRGVLTGFERPEADLWFSADRLDPRDLGLTPRRGEVDLREVEGRLRVNEEKISLTSFSARLNRSLVAGGLDVLRGQKGRRLVFRVKTRVLHLFDLLLLAGLEGPGTGDAGGGWSAGGVIDAGEGTLGAVAYRDLHAALNLEGDRLGLDTLAFRYAGGQVTAAGEAVWGTGGPPRYKLNLSASSVAAPELLGLLGLTLGMTGEVSATGDLTAAGATVDDIKRSLAGRVDLRVERGVIKRFAVLSKVLSLLNVSQLFRFRLPDMAREGMPYDRITGALNFGEGRVASDDLYLRSAAMNMVFVGEADMVKETLRGKVGAQPLQTLDAVVSRLPLVGWVLTDEDRRFITFYFDVDGPWSDPVVKPTPVRGLAEEVLGIFKRLFRLPAKLVKDPGEVLK